MRGRAVLCSRDDSVERRSVCPFGAVVSGAYQASPSNRFPAAPCFAEDEYGTRRRSVDSFGARSLCAERRVRARLPVSLRSARPTPTG